MSKFFVKLVLVLFGFFINSPKAAEQVTIQMLLEKGIVIIETYPSKAPKTVKRITELINQGFYDGLTFHRVISGFMAQGGDPQGNGTGGSGQKLNAEFSDYQYTYGTVGMARAMDPNSGDSQFFICFDGCGHLTGQYTVWGQVETGMGVVEKINAGEPPSNPDKIINASISE